MSNVIVGIDVTDPLRLRKGASLDISVGASRKNEKVWFLRYYDIDDTFKHTAEEHGTFCGLPLKKWLSTMGATHPWTVMRAKQLLQWVESGSYDQVLRAPLALHVVGTKRLNLLTRHYTAVRVQVNPTALASYGRLWVRIWRAAAVIGRGLSMDELESPNDSSTSRQKALCLV